MVAHLKIAGDPRSTVAPLGINPAVGGLTVTLEPLAPVAFIPPTTAALRPAYTSPSAPCSWVSNKRCRREYFWHRQSTKR